MSQDRRNPNPKLKSQISDYSISDTGVFDFFRVDKVRLGFKI
jgi:hypothetical protein